MVFHNDRTRQSFFRRQKTAVSVAPSHNNSQHVLAIVCKRKPHILGNNKDWGCIIDVPTQDSILEAFFKTSLLPSEVWRHQLKANSETSHSHSIILASNYPNCILESDHFCVLSAGFPYHYQEAFPSNKPQQDLAEMKTEKSFSRTVLDYCESLVQKNGNEETSLDLSDLLGQRLKKVSGHFSLYLVRKTNDKNRPGFWAFNDPFGFMPVYHHSLIGGKDGQNDSNENATTVLSSHWDCLVPALTSKSTRSKLQLDWDVVAEYLTLGTTLGGTLDDLDRTFVKGIENFKPGSCLSISNELFAPVISTKPYTACYGACEEIISTKLHDPNATEVPTSSKLTKKDKTDLISPLSSLNDNDDLPLPLAEMFAAFSSCVKQAVAQGHVIRAALTGGGDTRLILACLLMHEKETDIIFQTHSKQKTDWQIACHLSGLFDLKHEKIRAVCNTIGWDLLQQENLLSHLHDQEPKRRKQKKSENHKEDIVSFTLHGRFGTEFLGCLCYCKSPLDLRTLQEIENFRPKATKWFRAIFGLDTIDDNGLPEVEGKTTIHNPIQTLVDRFHQLKDDQHRFTSVANGDDRVIGLDAGFAFQLQVYTRSFFCDIYKGLRGGSWFSMPIAQFTRNAITPFLDNTLLRLLLCCVSETEKLEPYKLYGKLYTKSTDENSERILGILRTIPSNNKVLCNHTTIPRATKAPEATTRPLFPKFLSKRSRRQQLALEILRKRLSPIFWNGATLIFQSAKVKMNPKLIEEDPREEVRALVELLGSAEDACLLSGRLQSFLLWYERRFLVHLK